MQTEKKQLKTEGFSDTIKELYQFYKKNLLKENKKKFFILNGAMASSAILCGICAPLASKWSINTLSASIGKGALGAVYPLAAATDRIIHCVDSFMDTYIGTAWESLNFATRRPLALKKTKQAANIPEEVHKKPASEMAQVANQNAIYATDILGMTSQLAFQLPFAISSTALASSLNPAIGATILGTCVANGYLTYKNAKSNQQPNEEFRQSNNRYNSRQIDVVEHYQRVKNLGREEEENNSLDEISKNSQKILDKRNHRFRVNRGIQQALTAISNIGIAIWAGVEAVKSGDIGTAMAITSAASGAMFASARIINTWGRIKEEFDSWRHTEKDLQYDKSHDLNYGNRTPTQVKGLIEVKNASYTYPAEPPKPALSHVNLSIGHGMTVITGPSGSGKSTLLKLLQHTREGEGQILLDGVPLTELPKGFLETQTSIVNQRPDFFSHRTLRENLMSVQDHLTDSEIKKSLAKTALLDELSADEYEKKNMNQLSGGQQQRENITESFLQNKPIIIYDEPTANLDEENKRRIWRHLQRISSDKTVIIVTHDTREIESADRVIYLKDGKIVQDGTPEELQNKKGPVQDLLKAAKRPLKLSPEVIQEQKKQQEMTKLLKGLKSKKKRSLRKRLAQSSEVKKLGMEKDRT